MTKTIITFRASKVVKLLKLMQENRLLTARLNEDLPFNDKRLLSRYEILNDVIFEMEKTFTNDFEHNLFVFSKMEINFDLSLFSSFAIYSILANNDFQLNRTISEAKMHLWTDCAFTSFEYENYKIRERCLFKWQLQEYDQANEDEQMKIDEWCQKAYSDDILFVGGLISELLNCFQLWKKNLILA